jgi:hypothetical protein
MIVNVYVLEYKSSLVKLPNEVLANRDNRGARVRPTVSAMDKSKIFRVTGFSSNNGWQANYQPVIPSAGYSCSGWHGSHIEWLAA